MKYAPPIGSTDPNAGYVDRTGSIPGSPVPAAAIEPTMREIEHCIQQAGLTPDGSDLTQLYQSIPLLAQRRMLAAIDTIFQSGAYIAKATGWHRITLVGGGGGGAGGAASAGFGTGGGGGGGGYVRVDYVFLTEGQSVSCLIGAGGAYGQGAYLDRAKNGSPGGKTSFGTLEVTGGNGGNGGAATATGEAGSPGMGGSTGAYPSYGYYNGSQYVGSLGGAGYAHSGVRYGGGGSGGHGQIGSPNTTVAGYAGSAGVIIIERPKEI